MSRHPNTNIPQILKVEVMAEANRMRYGSAAKTTKEVNAMQVKLNKLHLRDNHKESK